MNRSFAAITWIMTTLSCLAAAADPASRLNQRYLLINTFRENTLKKELSEAAAAGFRVTAWAGMRHLVLEKVATPPETYQYRFAANGTETAQAGALGFRLHTLVRARVGDDEEQYDQVFLKPGGSLFGVDAHAGQTPR